MLKNRRLLQFAWLWLCVLAAVFPARAIAAEGTGPSFIVDSWNQKKGGLPGSSVISVIQTHDGYLWLGTLYGLVRFDGVQFTVFNEENTPGLGSDRIVYSFQDSHTNLWIGTDNGNVTRMRNGNFTSFQIGGAGHEGRLVYAFEDAKGTV